MAWVAWDTKASSVAERFLDSSPPHRGGLHPSTGQTVSSQDLDQRAWASHLAIQLVCVDTDGAQPVRAEATGKKGALTLRVQ
jgi:hypothetical protein